MCADTEWITDWISALSSVAATCGGFYALSQLPGWIAERRAVHRSQVATAAMVAAHHLLGVIIRSFHKTPNLKLYEKTMNDALTKFGFPEAVLEFERAFYAASAVLNRDEVKSLRAVNEFKAATFGAHIRIRRIVQMPTDGPDPADVEIAHGKSLLVAYQKVRDAVWYSLRPIARMAEKPKTRTDVFSLKEMRGEAESVEALPFGDGSETLESLLAELEEPADAASVARKQEH